ncbi:hypothetical protein LMG29739_06150 [Paraburkholderia solisilvae]|uniref:Uncharacterized protein n=1 Tax=Paraburkholderia solisilvae TaxID=624376 RepID=A0A6J5F2W4_9BURK|nr:hypothetical protein LMG29739_06150 [Paraburkholderia solisilvae]
MRCLISMRSGFFSRRPVSEPILPSSVAENSIVWREAGVAATIVSMSSIKPMSSMRSASSSTSICSSDRSIRPRSRWSSRRPGVATRISGFFASSINCWPYATPPRMLTVRSLRRCLPYVDAAVVTCIASSRVGVSTSRPGRATGCCGRRVRRSPCASRGSRGAWPWVFCSCAKRSIAGSMKAAVLPEPVGLDTSRSRPAMPAGIACC